MVYAIVKFGIIIYFVLSVLVSASSSEPQHFFGSIGASFSALLKKASTSDMVELKGAKISDLELAFLRSSFIESKLSSVKQSQGSSLSLTFSFRLNRSGSLYVNSSRMTFFSASLKISSV